jgi:FAD/FMN-containing dehydrogenase
MTTSDISSLEATFDGDIIPQGHPDYETSIARWAANASRRAKWVVFPKGPGAVSASIRWAVTNNIPLAIRCGGHAASGASSVEDGLVIDLSRHLASVRVDPKQKLAYIGGGALWEAVDKAVIEHSLGTVSSDLK